MRTITVALLLAAPLGAADRDPTTHWAYRPVVAARPPLIRNPSWPRNPIDHFIAAKQDEKGLVASPEAPRRVLVRRLYLDLLGLLPSPEQIAEGEKMSYEQLVDKLLASPHYGERWARHWLDVA